MAGKYELGKGLLTLIKFIRSKSGEECRMYIVSCRALFQLLPSRSNYIFEAPLTGLKGKRRVLKSNGSTEGTIAALIDALHIVPFAFALHLGFFEEDEDGDGGD